MSAVIRSFTVHEGGRRRRLSPRAVALATRIDRLREHDPESVRTAEMLMDRAYRTVCLQLQAERVSKQIGRLLASGAKRTPS